MKASHGVLAVALLLLPHVAAAADAEVRLEPYLWAAGLTGTVGVPGSGAGPPLDERVEATFRDLVRNLDIAGGGMVFAEYRRSRWAVFGDWTYVHLTSEAPSQLGLLFSGVGGDLKGNIVQAAVGYALREGTPWVELFGGLRYYALDLQLDLHSGLLQARTARASADWADGIAGARYEGLLGDRWIPRLEADIGTGGSRWSWQGVMSLAFRVPWGEFAGGWRYLKVDYDDGDVEADLVLSGPFFGVAFRW